MYKTMMCCADAPLMVKFTYVITHPTNAVPNPPTIEDEREVALEAQVEGRPNPERGTLLRLLAGTAPPDAWSLTHSLIPTPTLLLTHSIPPTLTHSFNPSNNRSFSIAYN
jgi:hypothetical protein